MACLASVATRCLLQWVSKGKFIVRLRQEMSGSCSASHDCKSASSQLVDRYVAAYSDPNPMNADGLKLIAAFVER